MRLLSFTILLVFCYTVNAADKIKLSCIGNSITEGYLNYSSYIPGLQYLLGSDYIVENDGVSGTTLLKKGNKSYWKYGKLSQVFNRPDVITIMLGTNDTKPENWDYFGDEFETDYLALIDTLLTLEKKPTIYLVAPVPVFKPTYAIRNEIIEEIIPIIKKIGDEKKLLVIDANTPLLEYGKHFPDGVHPDSVAASAIAKAIYAGIASFTSVNHLPYVTLPCKKSKHSFNLRCSLFPFKRAEQYIQFDLKGAKISAIKRARFTTFVTVIPFNDVH